MAGQLDAVAALIASLKQQKTASDPTPEPIIVQNLLLQRAFQEIGTLLEQLPYPFEIPLPVADGGTGESSFPLGVLIVTDTGQIVSANPLPPGLGGGGGGGGASVPPPGVVTSDGLDLGSQQYWLVSQGGTAKTTWTPDGIVTVTADVMASLATLPPAMGGTGLTALPPAGVLTSNGSAFVSVPTLPPTLGGTGLTALPPAGFIASNGSAFYSIPLPLQTSMGGTGATSFSQGVVLAPGDGSSLGAVPVLPISLGGTGVDNLGTGIMIVNPGPTISTVANLMPYQGGTGWGGAGPAVPPAGIMFSNGSAYNTLQTASAGFAAIQAGSPTLLPHPLPTANGGTGRTGFATGPTLVGTQTGQTSLSQFGWPTAGLVYSTGSGFFNSLPLEFGNGNIVDTSGGSNAGGTLGGYIYYRIGDLCWINAQFQYPPTGDGNIASFGNLPFPSAWPLAISCFGNPGGPGTSPWGSWEFVGRVNTNGVDIQITRLDNNSYITNAQLDSVTVNFWVVYQVASGS